MDSKYTTQAMAAMESEITKNLTQRRDALPCLHATRNPRLKTVLAL